MEESARAPWPKPFTSRLTRREAVLVLAYLPVHIVLLQLLFTRLTLRGGLSEPTANLLYYGIGFLYMLCAAFGFLRRDFDPLADDLFRCVRETLRGYLTLLGCNLLLGLLFMLLSKTENPNNAAVVDAVRQGPPAMRATLIYLAPFVEEMLFRAGIFGALRPRSRRAAYLVSALCFSLYHVAPYAVYAPGFWIYLLQYIPASLLLARCYERTNSVWCGMLFHMLVNGVALSALSAAG